MLHFLLAVSSVAKLIFIVAGSLGFDSWLCQTQIRHSVATAAVLFWNCVVQALSDGDGPCHSLHTSA